MSVGAFLWSGCNESGMRAQLGVVMRTPNRIAYIVITDARLEELLSPLERIPVVSELWADRRAGRFVDYAIH